MWFLNTYSNLQKINKFQVDENTIRTIKSKLEYDQNMFNITDDVYNNNLLDKHTVYKKTVDSNNLKIKNFIEYKYNNQGLLLREITKKRNEKVKDSTIYYYKNNIIQSIARQKLMVLIMCFISMKKKN